MADQVKTSFGYIGIISLSLLWAAFILNDLTTFLRLCYDIAKDLLKERREKKVKDKRKEIEQITIKVDDEYSQDLEKKLDQIHLQLLKACAKRRACENRRIKRKLKIIPENSFV